MSVQQILGLAASLLETLGLRDYLFAFVIVSIATAFIRNLVFHR